MDEIQRLKAENILLKAEISQLKQDASVFHDLNREIDLISKCSPSILWKTEILNDGTFANSYIYGAINQLLNLPSGTLGEQDWSKYLGFVKEEYIPIINAAFKKRV